MINQIKRPIRIKVLPEPSGVTIAVVCARPGCEAVIGEAEVPKGPVGWFAGGLCPECKSKGMEGK